MFSNSSRRKSQPSQKGFAGSFCGWKLSQLISRKGNLQELEFSLIHLLRLSFTIEKKLIILK